MSDSTSDSQLKVFISYTRESDEHDKRVAALARRIISELGFDCDVDQFHSNQNWPQWMEERLEWADRVIIVATPTYQRRWSGKEKVGIGLGAKWESLLTRQELYDLEGKTDKYVPVVFSPTHVRYIPKPLKGFTRIVFTPGGEIESLRLRLLGIAPLEKPKLPSVAPLAKADDQYFPTLALPTGRKSGTRAENAEAFDRSSLGISTETEELISNLFPIEYSPTLFRAVLPKRKGHKVFAEEVAKFWRDAGNTTPTPRDYILEGTTVYRLKPFLGEPWLSMQKRHRFSIISDIPTSTWANSTLFSEKNLFIKLLNGCLTELCRTHDMDFSEELACHLFVQRGSRYRALKVKSLTNFGTRELCKAIPDKNSVDPNAILHWQHQAFRHQFKRFNMQWFLVVTPFWAFTSDGGIKKSRFQNSWSSKARKPERNRAVLGHILLWKSVLCREEDMLRHYDAFRVKAPLFHVVTPSIVDQDWVALSKAEELATLVSD